MGVNIVSGWLLLGGVEAGAEGEERVEGARESLVGWLRDPVLGVPFVSWRVGKLLVKSSALGLAAGGDIGSQRAWVGCNIFGYCIWLVWISYIPPIVSLRVDERAELKRL